MKKEQTVDGQITEMQFYFTMLKIGSMIQKEQNGLKFRVHYWAK